MTQIWITAAGQRHFNKLIAKAGYTVAWGAPCKRKRFAGRVKPGGVAVLVKQPLEVRSIVPDACTHPAAHLAWEAGRFMHAVVPWGKQPIHVLALYGHPNSSCCLEQRGKRALDEGCATDSG